MKIACKLKDKLDLHFDPFKCLVMRASNDVDPRKCCIQYKHLRGLTLVFYPVYSVHLDLSSKISKIYGELCKTPWIYVKKWVKMY